MRIQALTQVTEVKAILTHRQLANLISKPRPIQPSKITINRSQIYHIAKLTPKLTNLNFLTKRDMPNRADIQRVAASCHLSLHVCNRSLLPRGLWIDSRAYVIGRYALANQNAVPHLCQSGRLSGYHA